MMYPHLGFYVCSSCSVCSDDICVIGYNQSTVKQKKRKCIHKRDEYVQSKIGKFSCREPFKGELQCENKLISYERAFKMLENDMYITVIGKPFSSYYALKSGQGITK